MCEANVYWKNKDDAEYTMLLEAVDKVIPRQDEITLVNIFGHTKTVRARIVEMGLVDHKIMLEKL